MCCVYCVYQTAMKTHEKACDRKTNISSIYIVHTHRYRLILYISRRHRVILLSTLIFSSSLFVFVFIITIRWFLFTLSFIHKVFFLFCVQFSMWTDVSLCTPSICFRSQDSHVPCYQPYLHWHHFSHSFHQIFTFRIYFPSIFASLMSPPLSMHTHAPL